MAAPRNGGPEPLTGHANEARRQYAVGGVTINRTGPHRAIPGLYREMTDYFTLTTN